MNISIIIDDWYKILKYFDILIWPFIVILILLIFRKPIYSLLNEIPNILKKFEEMKFPGLTLKRSSKDYTKADESIPPEDYSLKEKLSKDIIADLNNLILNAYNLSRNKMHEEAAIELKKAIQMKPHDWGLLHNLGVELIRAGKKKNNIELLIEAEQVCKNAIFVADMFPYGTYYNLARAQAASGNINGLKETLNLMKKIDLPENLGSALAKEDPDIRMSDDIANLQEYKDLIAIMKNKYKK